MPLTVWSQNSGYSLGAFEERIQFKPALDLPTTGSLTGVSFSIISGSLPPGLRLSGSQIIGTPFEVARPTTFKFCIRASGTAGIADRTFVMDVSGSDVPTILTPAGDLPLGPENLYFVLDESYVDFQIDAIDFDTATGQKLNYFIGDDEGELPPGLTLTDTGLLYGFVQPAYAIKVTDGTGAYGDGLFDAVAYDFGSRSSNGFDSFTYDSVFFDFNTPTNPPRRLNRNYEFIISVSDGNTVARRKFRIFVVADDYFKADNTLLPASTGVYRADGTFLRAGVWKTAENLGVHRANNYITILLDTYPIGETTVLTYSIDNENNLPPGMQFDVGTGEIFGTVPYQPAITKRYTFTVTATTYTPNVLEVAISPRTFYVDILGEVDSTISWLTSSSLGIIPANFISNLHIRAETTVVDAVLVYTIESGRLPPGLSLTTDGEIIGKVNQYGDETKLGLTRFYDEPPEFSPKTYTTFDGDTTTIDRSYIFTAKAQDQYGFSASTREFTVNVSTPNNKLYSNLTVRPFLPLDQRVVFKTFVNNSLIFTPSSIYRPNDPEFGIQTTLKMIAYAGIETTEAGKYVSAMGLNHKRKRFNFGSVKKAYGIYPGTTTVVYEIIYIEIIDPLEPNSKVLPKKITDIVADPRTITIDSSNNFWSRDTDILNITNDPFGNRPDPRLSIDQTNLNVSDQYGTSIYPNSIHNWRNNLKKWEDDNGNGFDTERNYLPLWMRSIQPGTRRELGFTLGVPICYCVPGTSDDIILNIKNSEFNFKQLDYTIDRYTIDAVTGYTNDKYLVFKNDRNTIT
jgi:hypothetical protein